MTVKKLKDFLDKNKVKYVTINHSPAYTAQEIAEIAHVSAKELAKTVIVKVDGKLAMVVLPAHVKVNFGDVQKATGGKNVELASEFEFQEKFPGCELGAMPPFGNLYDMDVYVTEDLTKDKKIAFNAGTHSELIKLAYEDFEKLVKPRVI
ncbi:aminoacyl-tRNA deacylase [Candidiatus Paracoxiella cheracis]|uniref:aminoacyl-tRNA deacylase n=1 Tax=Candidiatus Paracoxiella cheracis TaxID=3405120 RepID=UPI003BF4EE48